MTFLFVVIGVLVVGGAVFFLGRSSKSGRVETPAAPPPTVIQREVRPPAPAEAFLPPTPQPVVGVNVPSELAGFRIRTSDELSADRQQAMMAVLRAVPRPPKRLHQLISREFVNNATSSELSALVTGEPLIAAKVLATVNSPLYGLKMPIVSIGQAVTFLGFNAVRGIGLQYMLNDSFKAASPELKGVFETLWASSTLATELCSKLAQKLDVPEQGALTTHMVLYFIGQLATYSLMPTKLAVDTAKLGFMARLQAEQDLLGLGSAVVGGLLLQEWALPSSIVDDVRDIDRILITPATAMDAYRGPRLALCYLCARIGEKLARGTLTNLAAFDLLTEPGPELFHLRSFLVSPTLNKLPELLQADDVRALMDQMQEVVHLPGYRV